jgi:hypothetical protein
MKWKIEYDDGRDNEYIDPETHSLFMTNCKLVNHRKTAEKIFNGGRKTVCAWITCEKIRIESNEMRKIPSYPANLLVLYNPRVAPYWMNNGLEVDGLKFDNLRTFKKNVFIDDK